MDVRMLYDPSYRVHGLGWSPWSIEGYLAHRLLELSSGGLVIQRQLHSHANCCSFFRCITLCTVLRSLYDDRGFVNRPVRVVTKNWTSEGPNHVQSQWCGDCSPIL